jgi:3-phosphoshikimate 1-carboxyvinyltransferase
VPGDTSRSHRYARLSVLADGNSVLEHYGADCRSTVTCLRDLGVAITMTPVPGAGPRVSVTGRDVRGLVAPNGSTLRMMAGGLAAHPCTTRMIGDESLSRRPLRRVVMVPLAQLGTRLEAPEGRPFPTVQGADLHAIACQSDVPSAEVKSAVLLAGLQPTGTTSVLEVAATQDHTERAPRAFGAEVVVEGRRVSAPGGQRLRGEHRTVPGDISSAAFWACAAAALPGADAGRLPAGFPVGGARPLARGCEVGFLDVLSSLCG